MNDISRLFSNINNEIQLLPYVMPDLYEFSFADKTHGGPVLAFNESNETNAYQS